MMPVGTNQGDGRNRTGAVNLPWAATPSPGALPVPPGARQPLCVSPPATALAVVNAASREMSTLVENTNILDLTLLSQFKHKETAGGI